MKKVILATVLAATAATTAFAEIKKIYFDERITAEEQAAIKSSLFAAQIFDANAVIVQGGVYTVVMDGMKTVKLEAETFKVLKD